MSNSFARAPASRWDDAFLKPTGFTGIVYRLPYTAQLRFHVTPGLVGVGFKRDGQSGQPDGQSSP